MIFKEFGEHNIKTDQYVKLRKAIRTLLNSPLKAVLVTYPSKSEDYVEPTYGQCLALQDKNKILLLQQEDGRYVQLIAKDFKKIHRCPATEEEVQELLSNK